MRWTNYLLLPVVLLAAACSRNEEPPKPVGTPVKYQPTTTQSLRQVADSVPDLKIYDSIFHHSDLAHTLDSMRTANKSMLFTLFAPSDKAFQRAGITLSQVGAMSPGVLDSIVLYLSIYGYYPAEGISGLEGYQPLNTLLQVAQINTIYQGPSWNPGNGWNASNPFIYSLSVGYTNGSLVLNGTPATATGGTAIGATDGVLWEVDTVVTKPTQEAYFVVADDTSFSFYMAAARIDDSIYESNYVSLNNPVALGYTQDPDTVNMELMQGVPGRTFFIPTNDAFRKAGMFSIADIQTYVYNSVVVVSGNFYDPNYNVMTTNLDSAFLLFQQTRGVLYTQDMLNDPSLNRLMESPEGSGQYGQYATFWNVTLSNDNGQVVLHRNDYPAGPGARVISPKDVTALNGVVHAVDNLLLP